MFTVGAYVQIVNHSEPTCNGQYGRVVNTERAYDGTLYHVVELEEARAVCSCTDDELMEG